MSYRAGWDINIDFASGAWLVMEAPLGLFPEFNS